MNDRIIYQAESLNGAASALDKLAGTIGDVTRQLDGVDTSGEWWDKIRGSKEELRSIRSRSSELGSDSAKLAGSVRRAVEIFKEADETVRGLCKIEWSEEAPPYSSEFIGAKVTGAEPAGNAEAWGAVKDVLDVYSQALEGVPLIGALMDFLVDFVAATGGAGEAAAAWLKGFDADDFEIPYGNLLGIVTTFSSKLAGNMQERADSGGTMSYERVAAETVLETVVDVLVSEGAGTLVGVTLGAVVGAFCPVAAPAVKFVAEHLTKMLYNKFAGDAVSENVSDFILDKVIKWEDKPAGGTQAPHGGAGSRKSGSGGGHGKSNSAGRVFL